MKNNFKPVVGHRFNLRADWGVVDCQVPGSRAETKRCPTRGEPMV
jgi:hypothetical protein